MSSYAGQELIDALYNEFAQVSDDVIADINKAYNTYKTKYFFDKNIGILKGLIFKIKMILYENIETYRDLINRINFESDENELKRLVNTDIYYIETILQGTNFLKNNRELSELLFKYLNSLKYDDGDNYELRKYMIDKLNSIQVINSISSNNNDSYNREYLIWDSITEENYLNLKYGL